MAGERIRGTVRRSAASRRTASGRTIRDVMTPEPVTIGADAGVREMVLLLREHDVSGLPVVASDGRLVGVVSLTDLFRRSAEAMLEGRPPTALEQLVEGIAGPWEAAGLEDEPFAGEELGSLEAGAEAFGEPEACVEELMTPDPLTASPGDSVGSVAHRMAERGVHRAIVVDPSGGAIGIVTTLDLLRAYPETAS